jgi:hypothetical protein
MGPGPGALPETPDYYTFSIRLSIYLSALIARAFKIHEPFIGTARVQTAEPPLLELCALLFGSILRSLLTLCSGIDDMGWHMAYP